jgi:hypothetical protein
MTVPHQSWPGKISEKPEEPDPISDHESSLSLHLSAPIMNPTLTVLFNSRSCAGVVDGRTNVQQIQAPTSCPLNTAHSFRFLDIGDIPLPRFFFVIFICSSQFHRCILDAFLSPFQTRSSQQARKSLQPSPPIQ